MSPQIVERFNQVEQLLSKLDYVETEEVYPITPRFGLMVVQKHSCTGYEVSILRGTPNKLASHNRDFSRNYHQMTPEEVVKVLPQLNNFLKWHASRKIEIDKIKARQDAKINRAIKKFDKTFQGPSSVMTTDFHAQLTTFVSKLERGDIKKKEIKRFTKALKIINENTPSLFQRIISPLYPLLAVLVLFAIAVTAVLLSEK